MRAQLRLTHCDHMDYSLPGSSVHGIFQARILEWVAIFSSGDLPDPGIELKSPALAGWILHHRAGKHDPNWGILLCSAAISLETDGDLEPWGLIFPSLADILGYLGKNPNAQAHSLVTR